MDDNAPPARTAASAAHPPSRPSSSARPSSRASSVHSAPTSPASSASVPPPMPLPPPLPTSAHGAAGIQRFESWTSDAPSSSTVSSSAVSGAPSPAHGPTSADGSTSSSSAAAAYQHQQQYQQYQQPHQATLVTQPVRPGMPHVPRPPPPQHGGSGGSGGYAPQYQGGTGGSGQYAPVTRPVHPQHHQQHPQYALPPPPQHGVSPQLHHSHQQAHQQQYAHQQHPQYAGAGQQYAGQQHPQYQHQMPVQAYGSMPPSGAPMYRPAAMGQPGPQYATMGGGGGGPVYMQSPGGMYGSPAGGSGGMMPPPGSGGMLAVPRGGPPMQQRPPGSPNGGGGGASPSSLAVIPPPLPEPLRINTSLPLEHLREEVRVSMDPRAHLDFVRYLVSLADEIAAAEPDVKLASKQVQLLHGEALKWAKRLAEKGPGGLNGAKTPPCPDAMVYLAECHGNGMLGLPLDHDKAFSLYLQASKTGHATATYRVAVCYEVGAGTKRDASRAVQFFKKAASLGDAAALYRLGLILLHGDLGYAANPREGLVMLKRAAAAADHDHPHALHELASLHEPLSPLTPPPTSAEAQHHRAELARLVIPDPAYALELYTQAARLGYAPAQFRLGACFQDGALGCPMDAKASISWFTKAAEQGHADAELALSGWFLEGAEGVLRPNDEQAYAWARRAADKGLAKAEFAVGYYCEMGVGVPQSLDEARKFYQRSAAQGNRKAMDRLQELTNFVAGVRRRPERHDKGDCVIQ
ncbi:hypothetical protein BC828DRAFT_372287 [Blastocladiella britannica]|nr:hypothetical protein BC828DRAFT_372287 [Blastocladiella britannica]